MQAYCVKCRAKKEMKDAKSITMKNGKPATQGICPTCGTKMFRIGKAQYQYFGLWDYYGAGCFTQLNIQPCLLAFEPIFYDFSIAGVLLQYSCDRINEDNRQR